MTSEKEYGDVDAFKLFATSTRSYLEDIARVYAGRSEEDGGEEYDGTISKDRLMEETQRVLGELEEIEHVKEERDSLSGEKRHEYDQGIQNLRYAVNTIEQANDGVLPDDVADLKESIETRSRKGTQSD